MIVYTFRLVFLSTLIFRNICHTSPAFYPAFSALTLLVGWQEEHPACKKIEWWLLPQVSVWGEVQTCRCHPLSLTIQYNNTESMLPPTIDRWPRTVKSRLVLPF